ncbi:hypothetical protein Q9295_08550 [Xinfangfangia sp. CPCC 101601]|uniref:Tryptophan synthase subunit beta n=1 Tax=Pseudogemmobacter lacusdianii TaxID=3069608 RepID=A0ABU0VZV3_9RHOB|nr:hypothetical protein [Xinfangfangia sp. CPCC 101601]MDQ2066420.1 hypothetical protein [Xinfangfangia sp. CPCC 101601]
MSLPAPLSPLPRSAGTVEKARRRLDRQFQLFARWVPQLAGLLQFLQSKRARLIRIPLALLFILFGFVGFLPIVGFWMLPLGLFLLALDVPALQPLVAAGFIRGRRWWSLQRRKWRR